LPPQFDKILRMATTENTADRICRGGPEQSLQIYVRTAPIGANIMKKYILLTAAPLALLAACSGNEADTAADDTATDTTTEMPADTMGTTDGTTGTGTMSTDGTTTTDGTTDATGTTGTTGTGQPDQDGTGTGSGTGTGTNGGTTPPSQ
jgi:hypothetical protein